MRSSLQIGLRAAFVALGLVLWFWTQSLIGARASRPGEIGDVLHDWTAPAHRFLVEHPAYGDALLAISSAFIDCLGIFVLGVSIFGRTLRPFIGLLMVFILRQVCQGLCTLPPPEGMIWRDPGFPTLLVTYGVSNDLFFSGHTALAVLGAIELARLGKGRLTLVAIALAAGEMATVIILRAHYTMDVFAGAVAALFAASAAARVAPGVDRALTRMGGRPSRQASTRQASGSLSSGAASG